MSEAERTKVAVLGGGPAAIAAAFELTAPELEGRYEVTVYQPGWRLGGKCASGRNLAVGGRIEEHGLHVWFGFYDNAFRMMRTVYEELARPPDHPIATLEQAFDGCDELVLCDRQGDSWQHFGITFPRNGSQPGSCDELPGFWEVAGRVCRLALRQCFALGRGHQEYPRRAVRIRRRGGRRNLNRRGRVRVPRRAAPRAGAGRDEPGQANLPVRLLAGALSKVRDLLWEHVVRDRCAKDPALRLFFTTFDTLVSAICGIASDGVLKRGWETLDHLDMCEWLTAHGAKQVTVGATPAERAPLLRAVYEVAFAYPGGNIAAASAAAGTATRNLLRLLFGYRGSVLYKMRAGMGDTVMAPLYELLKRRGVKFEYFKAVSALHLAEDGKSVDAIELVPQVELSVGEYEPLVSVQGLGCWPSEPLWQQLRYGERLKGRELDFELEANPLGREPTTLRRGEGFDEVVLGIPVAALPGICSEIAACNPRFKRMLDCAETVGTQSFQLWLTRPTGELGWRHGENTVARTHVELPSTWCDMSYLLPREAWTSETGVRGVAYFCGALDDRPDEGRAAANDRTRENARQFLEERLGTLWPEAVLPGGQIDWSVLADPQARSGIARLQAQYWRANTTATERYVLTPAGSTADRLAADESGVENLLLAGDWTRNGVDGGCVEAAVTSGMQAARALIGHERRLAGEHPTWLSGDFTREVNTT